MSGRMWTTLLAWVLLLAVPGVALAGVCFEVAGFPEAAALDIVPIGAASTGPIQLAGQAQGVCGLGQPPALVQGTAIVDPTGAARVALKLLAVRPGCSSGDAELVLLPSPLGTASGEVRLTEGSVIPVDLTFDPTGAACQPRSPRPTACVANPVVLCLLQNRFRVTATRSAAQQILPGQSGKINGESGFFAFLEPSNVELVVKVLDGRGVNNHFWVVATPSAGVEYTLTVTDTQTGQVRTYSNPSTGSLSAPTFDSTAFPIPP